MSENLGDTTGKRHLESELERLYQSLSGEVIYPKLEKTKTTSKDDYIFIEREREKIFTDSWLGYRLFVTLQDLCFCFDVDTTTDEIKVHQ